jgi:hypothetical protein
MKKTAAKATLHQGLAALARAAGATSARRVPKAGVFRLRKPVKGLTKGALLIAVADTKGVALRVVDTPIRDSAESLEDIARRVAEIDRVAAQISAGAGPTVSPPALTAEEESVLRSGGLEPEPLRVEERHLLYQATAEYADLLRDSCSVEQAARILGVNASRIRQRLTGSPRTLYGIKYGKSWRIPRFQFQQRRLVPGIEPVISRLAEPLHPVAVCRWFTAPNHDLTVAARPVSPLEWLRSGNPPRAVADLAAQL